MARDPNKPLPYYGPPYDPGEPTLDDDPKPVSRRSNKAALIHPQYGPPYDPGTPKLDANDVAPVARRRDKAAPIRGPPIEREAFTIAEFCRAFRISEDMFFKIQRDGWGPKTMKVGTRTLISVEAANAWRREREAATAREYCVP